MGTFNTSDKLLNITDQVTGKKVVTIIKKYENQTVSEEMLDSIIQDIKNEFGEDHPAQVNLDDKTNEIEIILKDTNGRYIKCSSLKIK